MENYNLYLSFGIMILSALLVLRHNDDEKYAIKVTKKTPQKSKPAKRN